MIYLMPKVIPSSKMTTKQKQNASNQVFFYISPPLTEKDLCFDTKSTSSTPSGGETLNKGELATVLRLQMLGTFFDL